MSNSIFCIMGRSGGFGGGGGFVRAVVDGLVTDGMGHKSDKGFTSVSFSLGNGKINAIGDYAITSGRNSASMSITINGYRLGLSRSGEFGYYTGNMSKVTSEGGAIRRYEGWEHKNIFVTAEFLKVGIGENNNQINPWREAGDIYDDVTWIPGTVLPAAFEKGVRNFTNSSLARMTNSELYVMSKAAPFFKTVGNGLGLLGVGMVAAQGVWEYNNGGLRNSTIVDFGASAFLYAGCVIPGPWTSFFWGATAVYTGVRIFAGDEVDDYIDGN